MNETACALCAKVGNWGKYATCEACWSKEWMGKSSPSREDVYRLIDAERDRQREKWREKEHEFRGNKLSVLLEEVGEVAKAINEDEGPERLREELVQVAAVAVKWVQTL